MLKEWSCLFKAPVCAHRHFHGFMAPIFIFSDIQSGKIKVHEKSFKFSRKICESPSKEFYKKKKILQELSAKIKRLLTFKISTGASFMQKKHYLGIF